MDSRLLNLINTDLAADLPEPLTADNATCSHPIDSPRPDSNRNSRVTVTGPMDFHYYYDRLNVASLLRTNTTADQHDDVASVVSAANSGPMPILSTDYTATTDVDGDIRITADSPVWKGMASVEVASVSRTAYDTLVFNADPLILIRASATMPDSNGVISYQPQYGTIQRGKTDTYYTVYSGKNAAHSHVDTRLTTPIVKGAGTSLSTAAITPDIQPVCIPKLAICCINGASLMPDNGYYTIVHWLKFSEADLTKEHLVDIGDDTDFALRLDPANKRIYYYGAGAAKIKLGNVDVPELKSTNPFLLALEYYHDISSGKWMLKVRVNGTVIGSMDITRKDNIPQERLYYNLSSDCLDGMEYVYDYLMLFERKLSDDEHLAFYTDGSTVVKELTYPEYILSLRPSILLRSEETAPSIDATSSLPTVPTVLTESQYKNYRFNGGLQYTIGLTALNPTGGKVARTIVTKPIAKDSTGVFRTSAIQNVQACSAPEVTINATNAVLLGSATTYTYAAWVKLNNTPVTKFEFGPDTNRGIFFNHTNGSMMWYNEYTHSFVEEAMPALAGLNNGDAFLLCVTLNFDVGNNEWIAKFSVNGVQCGRLGISDSVPGGKTSMWFKYYPYDYSQTDAYIDSEYVTIYERLLSDDEQLELYRRGYLEKPKTLAELIDALNPVAALFADRLTFNGAPLSTSTEYDMDAINANAIYPDYASSATMSISNASTHFWARKVLITGTVPVVSEARTSINSTDDSLISLVITHTTNYYRDHLPSAGFWLKVVASPDDFWLTLSCAGINVDISSTSNNQVYTLLKTGATALVCFVAESSSITSFWVNGVRIKAYNHTNVWGSQIALSYAISDEVSNVYADGFFFVGRKLTQSELEPLAVYRV